MAGSDKLNPDSKKTIVVFDFDETLIVKDTLFDFARYSTPLPYFLFNTLCITPQLVRFVLHKLPNHKAKEALLIKFFKGMPITKFDTICLRYRDRLNGLTNQPVLDALNRHKARGDIVVIVSASIENWIKPWATQYGIQVIATRLLLKDNIITGEIMGKNCHGSEKVNRFLNEFPDRNNYTLISYGDGKSDAQIFGISDTVYKINSENKTIQVSE